MTRQGLINEADASLLPAVYGSYEQATFLEASGLSDLSSILITVFDAWLILGWAAMEDANTKDPDLFKDLNIQ